MGGKYVPIDLGEFELDNSRYFFVRKINQNAPNAKIYVDALLLSK